MSKKDNEKTNVMRILDMKKVSYESYSFEGDGTQSGEQVAQLVGKDPMCVFKTLVTVGASKKNHVFVIPVCRELDLKKAARAVGEKSVEMLKTKELLPTTGYVHGGCSPIGMKKPFNTTFDSSALHCQTVTFSAGKIGRQVELKLDDLKKVMAFSINDITTGT